VLTVKAQPAKLFTFTLAHCKTLLSIGALKLVRHSGRNVKSPDSRSGLGDNFSDGPDKSGTSFRIIFSTKIHSP